MNILPTAEEVTNLYLYGQLTKPMNMTDVTLIRASTDFPPAVQIDVNAYMGGPGRFATADRFEVVNKFFNPLTDIASFQLAPGIYTKESLWTAFGISTSAADFSRRVVSIDQAQYDDGKDDFLERAYIWNTTAFKISDDTTFVVEPGGNRYLKDFAVIPYLNVGAKENFDFAAGSVFGNIANSLLEPKIDPSKIGRKVDFDFSADRTVAPRLTFDDYVAQRNTATSANPLLYA